MNETEQPTTPAEEDTDVEGHNFRGFVAPDEDPADDVEGHSPKIGAAPTEGADAEDVEGHHWGFGVAPTDDGDDDVDGHSFSGRF